MSDLTPRQTELLNFFRSEFARHGVMPTTDKIRRAFGWRSNGFIGYTINALIERGYLRRNFGGRGIELIQPIGHDPRDCFCDWCNTKRIRAHETFIQALQVPAPILAGSNFKALGLLTRTCWQIGFPYSDNERAKPRLRKRAQQSQTQNVPSQIPQFHDVPQSSKSGTIKAGRS